MMGRMDVGEAFYCAPSGLADVVNLETQGGARRIGERFHLKKWSPRLP